MSNFAHFASRVFNVPLMIHPQKAEIIVAALGERLGVVNIINQDGMPIVAGGSDWSRRSDREQDQYGYDIVDGMAIIPVTGTLVHKNGGLVRESSGVMGYDGIRKNFLHALENKTVNGIIFDVDSPGGEVAGCFDLCDLIYNARGQKPIASILSECAYSAAYAIASSAELIYLPRTGGAGSIGVVCMHVDYSRSLENAGLKVTFVQYGDRKTDGAETRPLEGEALKRIQAEINKTGELFISLVARNRGISKKEIRDMQAGTFSGKDAVDNLLADDILSPDMAFKKLLDAIT